MLSHFIKRGTVFLVFVLFSAMLIAGQGETTHPKFNYKLVDYTLAPVYKQIKKQPENYTFLEKVNIYSITYDSDGLVVTGFMAAPKADGKYPLVIYNRGGNREYGHLLVGTATDVLAPIAEQGYVVVASNYRGNSGSEGKEEFGGSDVMDVINLAKNSGEFEMADNSKIGLFGVSRGGMMNYLTLKYAANYNLNVRCAISIGGIADLETTIKHHEEIGTVCEEIVPDFAANRAAAIVQRSVIYWVNELPLRPLLILHSYDDKAVSYEQILPFADSLDKYKVPYQLMSFKKDNHGIIRHREAVQQKIHYWLDKYLKNDEDFAEEETRIVVN